MFRTVVVFAVGRDEALRSLLQEIPVLADVIRRRTPYVSRNVARLLGIVVALSIRPRLLLVDKLSTSLHAADSAMMHGLLRLVVDCLDSGVLIAGRDIAGLRRIADDGIALDYDTSLLVYSALQ